MDVKSLYPWDCILLGSKSPRRKQLLESAGFDVQLVSTDVEEIYPDDLSTIDVPCYLAELKMTALDINCSGSELIVTADTIVIHNNTILGKPKSIEEAKSFLQNMSNATHQVVTGVSLKSSSHQLTFSEIAEVTIEKLNVHEIDYYVNNFEVMDKAGAYGIQDWIGLTKVSRIVGDYYTIVGLPVASLIRHAIKLY